MSRPLIMKVKDHKLEPNKKVVGSVNVQLLKENTRSTLYETYSFENDNAAISAVDEVDNPPDEIGSRSIVRNLISRYETSRTFNGATGSKATLNKYKSKSLADLPRPQVSAPTKTTQDDLLYYRNKYSEESENEKFDFRKVFLKFETSSKTTPTINQPFSKPKNKNYKSLDLTDIKQQAKILLENQSSEYSSWQNQVVELLQQISNLEGSGDVNRDSTQNLSYGSKTEKKVSPVIEENVLKRTQSYDNGYLKKNPKVKDIKNLFEAKVDDTKHFTRSVSAYFGLKDEEYEERFNNDSYRQQDEDVNLKTHNGDFNNEELVEDESEDSDNQEDGSYDVDYEDIDLIEGNRIITQPVMASSVKIRKLKNFFESEPDKYVSYQDFVRNRKDKTETNEAIDSSSESSASTEIETIHVVDNRMLPPPKMIILDEQTDENITIEVENSKQQIEELTKNIEDYEHQITNLSVGNNDEGSYINEVLIRILIKLDDIKTYGDEVILTERRKAIQFVQSCITKLKNRIHGRK